MISGGVVTPLEFRRDGAGAYVLWIDTCAGCSIPSHGIVDLIVHVVGEKYRITLVCVASIDGGDNTRCGNSTNRTCGANRDQSGGGEGADKSRTRYVETRNCNGVVVGTVENLILFSFNNITGVHSSISIHKE